MGLKLIEYTADNDIIIIGGASRNAGKTRFMCALLRSLSEGGRVVNAAKIVTVEHSGKVCPRGAKDGHHGGSHGCGACFFDGGFVLKEEAGAASGAVHDTARFLEAGASRSFLLRSKKDALPLALAELRKSAGGGLLVAESNSARLFVKPRLFVFVDGGEEKPSAERVRQFADVVVKADGGVDAINLDTLCAY